MIKDLIDYSNPIIKNLDITIPYVNHFPEQLRSDNVVRVDFKGDYLKIIGMKQLPNNQTVQGVCYLVSNNSRVQLYIGDVIKMDYDYLEFENGSFFDVSLKLIVSNGGQYFSDKVGVKGSVAVQVNESTRSDGVMDVNIQGVIPPVAGFRREFFYRFMFNDENVNMINSLDLKRIYTKITFHTYSTVQTDMKVFLTNNPGVITSDRISIGGGINQELSPRFFEDSLTAHLPIYGRSSITGTIPILDVINIYKE